MPTGVVTVSSYTPQPAIQVDAASTFEVRGWYTRSFIAGDGVTAIEGNTTSGEEGFYYSVPATVNAENELVVPAHDIQATTLSNPTANYFEGLWIDGAFTQMLMPNNNVGTGWQIPTIYGSVIAIDEIALYNRAKRLLYPPSTYPTFDEVVLLIQRLAGNFAYAAVDVNGITSLNVAPSVASLPIALNAENPVTLIDANLKFDKETVATALTATQGAAGNVDVGDHTYTVTFVTPSGETSAGATTAITVAASAKQVALSNIPVGSDFVTARKIWRSKASAPVFETDFYYLLTTINNNTATTFNDNVADSGLGAAGGLLDNNSTSARSLLGTVPASWIGETNTSLGFRAGAFSETLFDANSGSYNTNIGARTAPNSTTGSFNTNVGYESGLGITTGLQNTNIGSQAGFRNATGDNNTFVGQVAGAENLGSNNVAVGSEAMWFPSTTMRNTALGFGAMRGTTPLATGNSNVAVGAGSMFVITTGDQNVATGDSALGAITTGAQNVGVGYLAGGALISGSNNVAVGTQAGQSTGVATANFNTSVGNGALASVSSGGSNTAVGGNSSGGITTGQQNAALGLQSLNATTTGSNNVGVGVNAGATNTTGSNNTLIGAAADVVGTGRAFATAIGAGATVAVDNAISLGRSTGADTVRIPGLTVQLEGAVLSISSNTIAPTNSIHHVGAGLIKTITVPTNFTSGSIDIIPDAAFTYDATGNIIGTGTATIGRVMRFTYSSSSSKWYASY